MTLTIAVGDEYPDSIFETNVDVRDLTCIVDGIQIVTKSSVKDSGFNSGPKERSLGSKYLKRQQFFHVDTMKV